MQESTECSNYTVQCLDLDSETESEPSVTESTAMNQKLGISNSQHGSNEAIQMRKDTAKRERERDRQTDRQTDRQRG